MLMDWSSIVPALITGLLSLAGVYFANRKSSALIEYRLRELEKRLTSIIKLWNVPSNWKGA